MEFNEKLLHLEAQLSDLGPGKGVDLGVVLEDQDAHMDYGKVQGYSFVILKS